MKNLVSIIEIPTEDFARAVKFYQSILNIAIETVDMHGAKFGLFPGADDGVFIHLINDSAYKTSSAGTLVYLNGGDDLQSVASKIEASGGKMVIPKTEIAPEMGYYAHFIDSEGNKLGLHSPH